MLRLKLSDIKERHRHLLANGFVIEWHFLMAPLAFRIGINIHIIAKTGLLLAKAFYQNWRDKIIITSGRECCRSNRSKFTSIYHYHSLSIYRGTIWHDIAPSTTISKVKLRLDFELKKDTHSSPWRASYGCPSWVIRRRVTARYREPAVLTS